MHLESQRNIFHKKKKKSSFKWKNPYLQQSFAKKIDTKPSMHLESRKHISKLVDLETHLDELWS